MIGWKLSKPTIAEGLTANTIKHYHANIHKALKYAVKIGLISCNESEKTDRPKLDKYEATFYNSKELERLFSVFTTGFHGRYTHINLDKKFKPMYNDSKYQISYKGDL